MFIFLIFEDGYAVDISFAQCQILLFSPFFIFRKKVEQSVNHGNFFTCLVARGSKIVNWSFDSIKFSDKRFGTFILFAVA